MATTNPPQRAWRAACPNCGAPVDFASAASPIAVCSFCRSTLARDGEALRRIGQSAELFDDHSPLQLGAAGRWQGLAFTVIGRLQLRYEGGSWNEWHALFDSGDSDKGKSGWLSEDNGRYVMAFDQPTPADVPPLAQLLPGAGVGVGGRLWQVASVTRAQVVAAQGELLAAPKMAEPFMVVDLRNAQDEVGTLDYATPTQPRWAVGRSAALLDLQLTGLREASEQSLQARGLQCPSCGTALAIKLQSTKSIVCHQCQAVVDVSQGVGGDLAHYAQDNGAAPESENNSSRGGTPQLPLGATATLSLGAAPQSWQVVGYVERCEIPDDPENDRVFWREYLLYNRNTGFVFLVDAEDGWSWAAPLTGAPQVRGNSARWQGIEHSKRYSYTGEISHVLGEFYWKLQRGERTLNTDYAIGNKRLNREQVGTEVTWSWGETLDAQVVSKAFNLPAGTVSSMTPEASPLSGGGRPFIHKLLIGIVLLVVLVMVMRACSADTCDGIRNSYGAASNEYQQCRNNNSSTGGGVVRTPRTGGGSFGGYGSGSGGHK